MLAKLCGHGANDGEVVGARGNLGQHVGDFDAGLSARFGLPVRGLDVAVGIELGALEGDGHGFTVEFLEEGFGIEGVDVRDAAGHVEEDDRLGLGGVVEFRNQ